MAESTRAFSPRPATPQGRLPHPNPNPHSPGPRSATGRGENKHSNPFDIIPPHSPEIERCVLGCMLIDRLAYEVAVEMLSFEVFYVGDHARLFAFFVAVYNRVRALDETIAASELEKSGRKEMRDYLGKLIMAPTTAANVEGYCNELLRYAADRKRLTFALRIIKEIQGAAK